MDPRLIPRASLRPRDHQAEKAVHWHYCSHQLGLNHHPHRVWNEGLLRSLGKDCAHSLTLQTLTIESLKGFRGIAVNKI